MNLHDLLRHHVAADAREEADRCAMVRLAGELEHPLSRDEPSAHFTASAFVVDEPSERVCLVTHVKLGRLLQPGGHVEPGDASLEEAAMREAREETALELACEADHRAAICLLAGVRGDVVTEQVVQVHSY